MRELDAVDLRGAFVESFSSMVKSALTRIDKFYYSCIPSRELVCPKLSEMKRVEACFSSTEDRGVKTAQGYRSSETSFFCREYSMRRPVFSMDISQYYCLIAVDYLGFEISEADICTEDRLP